MSENVRSNPALSLTRLRLWGFGAFFGVVVSGKIGLRLQSRRAAYAIVRRLLYKSKGTLKSMKKFSRRIREFFNNIPFKTYVTVLLEGLGLFANTIAIVTFFGAQNTPQESPNFYINSQEFFVWSLIAAIYTLGLLSARFKRRWRNKLAKAGIEENYYRGDSVKSLFFRGELHWQMFIRDFSFTLAITFPLTLLYVRAMQAAATEGVASPWTSLGTTVLVCLPVAFCIMISSSIFDKALSLYAGD